MAVNGPSIADTSGQVTLVTSVSDDLAEVGYQGASMSILNQPSHSVTLIVAFCLTTYTATASTAEIASSDTSVARNALTHLHATVPASPRVSESVPGRTVRQVPDPDPKRITDSELLTNDNAAARIAVGWVDVTAGHTHNAGVSPTVVASINSSTNSVVAGVSDTATLSGSITTFVRSTVPTSGSSSGSSSSTSTSLLAAGRILNQTTFGPTVNDLIHVQTVGVPAYIAEQLNQPASLMPNVLDPADYAGSGDCNGWSCKPEARWWETILFGPDQLRQRVAFALSKLFSVSMDSVDARYFPQYLNVLSQDALGNWFDILNDVARTPAMGTFLNMANSQAATNGGHADENFARETMQLFSIGISSLNEDGSQQLDSNGRTIPNYTPSIVQSFARVYTGWTFSNTDCSAPSAPQYYWWPNPPGQGCPMMPIETLHDTEAKTLLRGVTLPAGQTAEADLTAALQNIFQDPSLPPFVCRRLIQNMVTSNPSPAYVSRIASVFTNNGKGVRGDTKAVISAMLLDPEARIGDSGSAPAATTGLMRDPVLLWTSILRAANATQNLPEPWIGVYTNTFDQSLTDLAESPHYEPSVFSFYSPNFTVTLNGSTIYAPEAQLSNILQVQETAEHIQDLIANNLNARYFTVDLSATSPLGQIASSEGPAAVVDICNAVLLHGTMSASMRAAIIEAVSIPGLDPGSIAQNAVYLVVMSPQYRTML